MISSIIDNNERVGTTVTIPGELTRVASDGTRHVTRSVVLVVTDRRVLFVADGSGMGDPGQTAASLAYADITAVGIEGETPTVLAVSMADGVRWKAQLPDDDPEAVGSLVRHVRWVGQLRTRIVACRNDVELAAGEIRDHADAMDWDKAEAIYEEQRETLDQILNAVQWTKPIDDAIIAPELTEIERTLERAYARLFIDRAKSKLELGRQLVGNEHYDQARTVLQTAHEYYERAQARADAVERGDAFRFGEQRELRDDIDRLSWELEAVAAEPIRQAHEAKILAIDAESPDIAVDHWETAFRRYGDVLTLEWGDADRRFAGDQVEVREERDTAADRLIECHRELARDQWDDGVQQEESGDIKRALQHCSDATDHLERAKELATEYRPDDVDQIRQRHEQMQSALTEMRQTATVERQQGRDDQTDDDDDSSETDHSATIEELRDIDTHQEITLDMSIEEQATDGGQRRSRSRTPDDQSVSDEDDSDDIREYSSALVSSDGSEVK